MARREAVPARAWTQSLNRFHNKEPSGATEPPMRVSVATVAWAHGVNANQVFGWRKLYHAGLLRSIPAASFGGAGRVAFGCCRWQSRMQNAHSHSKRVLKAV
jgi:hypothetical protein